MQLLHHSKLVEVAWMTLNWMKRISKNSSLLMKYELVSIMIMTLKGCWHDITDNINEALRYNVSLVLRSPRIYVRVAEATVPEVCS